MYHIKDDIRMYKDLTTDEKPTKREIALFVFDSLANEYELLAIMERIVQG